MAHKNQPTHRLPARTWVLAALLAGLALTVLAPAADAAPRRHRPVTAITPKLTGATDPNKDAALIIDGATGKVLYARNETLERHPASLTKMMTLYMLFDALRTGKITMQTQMPVSRHATVQMPTKLYLRPGQTIDVDTAIRAMVIRSANDVAVVTAEALGGTESHFAEMMTAKARELGMRETNYHNASGVPDPLQITTATDLAVLARHLAYDFPQYFPYFGTPGFTYKGVYTPTHDNLIGRYPGADGIKTGYVDASGFNLASSVVRDGVHLIGIVMGGRTAVRRDLEMMHLMDAEFAAIQANPTLVARGPVPWHDVAAAAASPRPGGFVTAASAAAMAASSLRCRRCRRRFPPGSMKTAPKRTAPRTKTLPPSRPRRRSWPAPPGPPQPVPAAGPALPVVQAPHPQPRPDIPNRWPPSPGRSRKPRPLRSSPRFRRGRRRSPPPRRRHVRPCARRWAKVMRNPPWVRTGTGQSRSAPLPIRRWPGRN